MRYAQRIEQEIVDLQIKAKLARVDLLKELIEEFDGNYDIDGWLSAVRVLEARLRRERES